MAAMSVGLAAMELPFCPGQNLPSIAQQANNCEWQTYEILDVIEFSSKRRRMSVIVRCPGGKSTCSTISWF